jgi:DNA-binding MarR family transcriptional regulator
MAWVELMDEVAAGLAAAGFEGLRPVHRPILRDLLTSGQRPTELAARMGVSKQTANDLLRELEQLGYITLVPDPDDGRAKRIAVTERGRQLGREAARLSETVGRRWAARVGERRFATFERVLHEIVTDPATASRDGDPKEEHTQ